jgi:Glycosyl transferases group 1
MINRSENITSNKARVLMYSQRNISEKVHFRSILYEFEDIIRLIDSVELLAPQPKKWFNYGTRIANRIAADCAIALNPGIPNMKIKGNYDLFFAICQFPKDLLHIAFVEGWKDHCRTSICMLNEIYSNEIYKHRCYLKILSKFDYVILNHVHSVKAVNEAIGGKCFYLPFGIDAVLFCPYPKAPQRFIDVLSIGRRSEDTHHALIKMVKEDKIFYVYDSINGQQVFSSNEHRLLFANMAKRSRYFIVNPGHMDSPERTGGESEIGFRYFEGAASGSILIGESPINEEFLKIFNWPDAIIHLPYGSSDIGTIISELDKQPQRQEKIRRNNVVQSLMNFDCAYRWEKVLQTAGLDPMPKLLERKKYLRDLANIVEEVVLP